MKCNKCSEPKSKSDFYKSNKSICKDCLKKSAKKYREDNIERVKEYDKGRANNPERVEARKAYAKTEEGIIAGNRAKKRWQDNNAIKRGAHVITGNAIRDGKLIKVPCENCGDPKVHAHHDDYAKPLEVRWLCSTCHKDWHKEHGEAVNGN